MILLSERATPPGVDRSKTGSDAGLLFGKLSFFGLAARTGQEIFRSQKDRHKWQQRHDHRTTNRISKLSFVQLRPLNLHWLFEKLF
jgi:hypothetical protein